MLLFHSRVIFHRWDHTAGHFHTPAHTEKPNLSDYNRKQTQQISDEGFSDISDSDAIVHYTKTTGKLLSFIERKLKNRNIT